MPYETKAGSGDQADWKVSFDDAAEEQLKAEIAATPKERIEALEALIDFAHRAGALANGR